MPQTQTQLQEHLTAVRDELKSAAAKQVAEVKTRVNEALRHARAAQSELKAKNAADDANAKKRAEEIRDRLEEIQENGKRAMDEAGSALQTRVRKMLADAENAVKLAAR